MPDHQLRAGFQRDLQEIDGKVVQLFALVGEGLAAATEAFLAGDRESAKQLLEQDALIDSLYHDVERLVQHQFALQTPMARDLRFLLSVLRIVPELERSGDLAEHIAQKAARGLTDELTPRIRGLIEQMGRVGVEMWRRATDAYVDRDADAYDQLHEADDELDDLHLSLTAELVSGTLTVPVALEMSLVGRYYERLGDHAVNVANRVRYLARGESD
ncbi:MAG TPA: phosphate signaling complex protein PhoU [Acidimicrobiales bacterium]|nr:phosphate signaling complex protein PhoU [Acidimicrobiales bacterium]